MRSSSLFLQAFSFTEFKVLDTWGTLPVLWIKLVTVPVPYLADVIVVQVVDFMVVAALTHLLFWPVVAFWVLSCWNAIPIDKFVVLSAWSACSVLGLFLTVEVGDLLFLRYTFTVYQLVLLDAWSTFSIQSAVLLAILSYDCADVVVVKEIPFNAFKTFASTTLAWSWSTEGVLTCRNAFPWLQGVEIPAFRAFALVVLFGTIRVGLTNGSWNLAFSVDQLEILLAFCTVAVLAGVKTVRRKKIAFLIWVKVISVHTLGTNAVSICEKTIVRQNLALVFLIQSIPVLASETFALGVSLNAILWQRFTVTLLIEVVSWRALIAVACYTVKRNTVRRKNEARTIRNEEVSSSAFSAISIDIAFQAVCGQFSASSFNGQVKSKLALFACIIDKPETSFLGRLTSTIGVKVIELVTFQAYSLIWVTFAVNVILERWGIGFCPVEQWACSVDGISISEGVTVTVKTG